MDDLLLRGFYLRVHVDNLSPSEFYRNYFETYIQRDLRQLSQIDNLHLFEKFVHLLATRVGQLLNLTSLANDLGVSQPTLRHWTSLLEASYIITLLPPFYKNIGKRLIKTPKLYFFDVGFAAYLLGIETSGQLPHHPLRGALFENFMVVELLKKRFNLAKASNLYFYRDRTGNEVDVVLERALDFIPIEIKSAQTPHATFNTSIEYFRRLFPQKVKKSFVIYGGESSFQSRETLFIPWPDTADTDFE